VTAIGPVSVEILCITTIGTQGFAVPASLQLSSPV